MAQKSLGKFSIFLVIACLTNSALSTQIAPPVLPSSTRIAPPVSPSSTNADEELRQCWSPLRKLNGCVEEIYHVLVVEGNGTSLRSACCGAVAEISDSCWTKMFSLGKTQLNVAENLKASCTTLLGVSPSSKSNDDYSDNESGNESDDESGNESDDESEDY